MEKVVSFAVMNYFRNWQQTDRLQHSMLTLTVCQLMIFILIQIIQLLQLKVLHLQTEDDAKTVTQGGRKLTRAGGCADKGKLL